jgi:hypothetical protein
VDVETIDYLYEIQKCKSVTENKEYKTDGHLILKSTKQTKLTSSLIVVLEVKNRTMSSKLSPNILYPWIAFSSSKPLKTNSCTQLGYSSILLSLDVVIFAADLVGVVTTFCSCAASRLAASFAFRAGAGFAEGCLIETIEC